MQSPSWSRTFVEWEHQSAIDKAREAVSALHKQLGFNPQEMLARLGIRAELGNYRHIDA